MLGQRVQLACRASCVAMRRRPQAAVEKCYALLTGSSCASLVCECGLALLHECAHALLLVVQRPARPAGEADEIKRNDFFDAACTPLGLASRHPHVYKVPHSPKLALLKAQPLPERLLLQAAQGRDDRRTRGAWPGSSSCCAARTLARRVAPQTAWYQPDAAHPAGNSTAARPSRTCATSTHSLAFSTTGVENSAILEASCSSVRGRHAGQLNVSGSDGVVL